jgi:hypothetical protein
MSFCLVYEESLFTLHEYHIFLNRWLHKCVDKELMIPCVNLLFLSTRKNGIFREEISNKMRVNLVSFNLGDNYGEGEELILRSDEKGFYFFSQKT